MSKFMSMITNYKEAFDAIDDIGAFKESTIRIILHALGYVDDRPPKDKIQRLREQYEKTYNYAELIKKYRLEEDGTWGVEGEDPNCDFGGSHISLEESKKMAIDFIVSLKELLAKHLVAGNPLEPLLPLSLGNFGEELG